MTHHKLIQGDCLQAMKDIPDNSIDLTITSPPYDGLRCYNGFSFVFEDTARELFRITKKGGVVVWVVGDSTTDGSESGTSFKQALYFKEIGFNLHDTMIYLKKQTPFPPSNRYNQGFEYMFVLSKGKPKTFNPIKVKTIYKSKKQKTTRQQDGTLKVMKYSVGKDLKTKMNYWFIDSGYQKSSKDKIAFQHPAIFPEQLAYDHVISWSNEGDVVFDPFAGSGTVMKQAVKTNRESISIEISEKYCNLIKERCFGQQSLFEKNTFEFEVFGGVK